MSEQKKKTATLNFVGSNWLFGMIFGMLIGLGLGNIPLGFAIGLGFGFFMNSVFGKKKGSGFTCPHCGVAFPHK